MGIYIPGMEMPKTCHCCKMCVQVEDGDIGWNWECCLLADAVGRYAAERIPGCPLVPVPPHGRLIGADALMLKIQEYIEEYSETDERGWHNEKWCAMKETEMAINDAPTIIPADPAEEGET